jgi:hypothetical protein
LCVAAALNVWRVAIDNLGQLSQTPLAQKPAHAGEIMLRGFDRISIEIPRSGQSLAKDGERPCPGGAVVVSRLSPGILVAFITTDVRFVRIVQWVTVWAANRQWWCHWQRRERSQGTRHQEVPERGLDTALSPFSSEETEAHCEEAIAPQSRIDCRILRELPRPGDQEIGEVAPVFQPKMRQDGLFGAIGK